MQSSVEAREHAPGTAEEPGPVTPEQASPAPGQRAIQSPEPRAKFNIVARAMASLMHWTERPPRLEGTQQQQNPGALAAAIASDPEVTARAAATAIKALGALDSDDALGIGAILVVVAIGGFAIHRLVKRKRRQSQDWETIKKYARAASAGHATQPGGAA